MPNLVRVTMFKIERENVDKLLEAYGVLASTAVRDGKPYILSLHAGRAHDDVRSQGYNVVAKSEFKNLEDMTYYDTECEAHKVLKEKAKAWGVQGIMTVYFEPGVVSVL